MPRRPQLRGPLSSGVKATRSDCHTDVHDHTLRTMAKSSRRQHPPPTGGGDAGLAQQPRLTGTYQHTLPDGRELRIARHGRSRWLALDADQHPVVTRDLRTLLEQLLRDQPDWVPAALEAIDGRVTPHGRRFACACCGCFTLERTGHSTFLICPVCFWEDDGFQRDHPDEPGTNAVSLREARDCWRDHGVSETRYSTLVRAAHLYELP